MSTGRLESELRLIADIGGTNARFALLIGGEIQREKVLVCADYPSLIDAVETYLRDVQAGVGAQRPLEASLAIAGPITADLVRMTNHAWQFSAAATREQLKLRRLIILNDFTALAMSIRHLPRTDFEQVGGAPPHDNEAIGIIGPGTGLGVSGLIPLSIDGRVYWSPLQGEGGHVSLPFITERERRLGEVLQQRLTQVSAEQLLSGPGLMHLQDALSTLTGKPQAAADPEEISARGLQGDPFCREILDIFCALLGSVASNLALTLGATGGVYLGGGIVPQLGEFFRRSQFRARFDTHSSPQHAKYLAAIPVFVIRAQRPAFTGAARSFVDPGPRLEV